MHREVVGYDVKVETTQHFDGHIETKEVGNRPIYENVSHTTHTMTDLAREVAPPSEPKLKEMPNSLVSVGCGAIGCLMPITLTIIYFVAKYQFNKDIWAWMDYLMYAFIACTVFYLIKGLQHEFVQQSFYVDVDLFSIKSGRAFGCFRFGK